VVVDAGDRTLAPFDRRLREHTAAKLQQLGVEVVLQHTAAAIDRTSISLKPTGSSTSGDGHRIASRTVLWAAGVAPSPLAAQLAAATGADLDDHGRLVVDDHCRLPRHPEIFVIGDLANVHDLPGLAEPAMQEGRHVAKVISGHLDGRPAPRRFRYRDLGTMATIAPDDAVAQLGPLRLTGLPGKVAWAAVHLAFLVGWGNRAAVLSSWARSVVRGSRRQQVILGTEPGATT
jgi:NADH dehydrogenase